MIWFTKRLTILLFVTRYLNVCHLIMDKTGLMLTGVYRSGKGRLEKMFIRIFSKADALEET